MAIPERRLRSMPLVELTVLVVDDDPDTTESFATWLSLRGANAVQAQSVPDAWAILEHIAVDAVVVDLAMPEQRGEALAGRVREDVRFERLPLIAISGVVPASERGTLLESGFDAFHTKPVAPARIVSEIRALVQRVR